MPSVQCHFACCQGERISQTKSQGFALLACFAIGGSLASVTLGDVVEDAESEQK